MHYGSDKYPPTYPPFPPLQAFPLPPSKMRAVPCAPCLPIPKPYWPLCLGPLPPVDLTSLRHHCLAAPLTGEQLRDFGVVPLQSGFWELLGLQDGRPEGFLLAPPLGGRSSRVWMLYWHQQHCAAGRLVVHWRYCPVRRPLE